MRAADVPDKDLLLTQLLSTDEDLSYVGLGPRLCSALVDGFLLTAALVTLSCMLLVVGGNVAIWTTGTYEATPPPQYLIPLLATAALLLLGLPITYFTLFWRQGQTFGMKAVRIWILCAERRQVLPVRRALARASILTLGLASASFLLLTLLLDAATTVTVGAAAAATLALLLHLPLPRDVMKRSLLDRISGTVMVRSPDS
jgi:hypothetical protein